MKSIQRRFFRAFLLVILIAVGTEVVIVLRAVTDEIEQYDRLAGELEITRISHWLTGYFEIDDSWEGVQPYLDEMSALSGRRLVVTDAAGMVVADTATDASEARLDRSWPSRDLGYREDDEPVGRLYVSREQTILQRFRSRMVRSIRRALLLGSGVAIALALLASMLVARPLSRPIRELVSVAENVGHGDFGTRARVPRDAELATLARTLNAMMVDLETAARLRRNMVADIAHELRTPLTNIRGYLEARRDGVVTDEASTAIIESETALLVRLVDDLQELALAESDALRLERQQFDLRTVADEAVATSMPTASRNGLQLERRTGDDPIVINADPVRVAQVVTILLANATKHSPRGTSITVATAECSGFAEISVSDEGVGIPADELPHIFERFYRVDPSRSRQTGGSGLGLTIAKHLVEAHGGTIVASSEPGRGSCFTVRLPR